jgi:hypothetical protein
MLRHTKIMVRCRKSLASLNTFSQHGTVSGISENAPKYTQGSHYVFGSGQRVGPGPTPIDKAYWRSDLSGKPKPGQYEPETGGHLADVGLIDKARAEPG